MTERACTCTHAESAHDADGYHGSKNACERCYCNRFKDSGLTISQVVDRMMDHSSNPFQKFKLKEDDTKYFFKRKYSLI